MAAKNLPDKMLKTTLEFIESELKNNKQEITILEKQNNALNILLEEYRVEKYIREEKKAREINRIIC